MTNKNNSKIKGIIIIINNYGFIINNNPIITIINNNIYKIIQLLEIY